MIDKFALKDNQGNPLDLGSSNIWVIMDGRKTTVLIDPMTGSAYHSTNKKLAELIAKDCRERLELKGTFVLPLYEAIRIIAANEGVDLKPPYTTKNIIDQLKHGFETGAHEDKARCRKLKNKASITNSSPKDRYSL